MEKGVQTGILELEHGERTERGLKASRHGKKTNSLRRSCKNDCDEISLEGTLERAWLSFSSGKKPIHKETFSKNYSGEYTDG